MAFNGGSKRTIGAILYRRIVNCSSSYNTTSSRHTFSTFVSKRVHFARTQESQTSVLPKSYNLLCGSVLLLRRFSAEASTSEQMSLIKQLREKTSAPIKDVKASLINCNWDIGISPFYFRIIFYLLLLAIFRVLCSLLF